MPACETEGCPRKDGQRLVIFPGVPGLERVTYRCRDHTLLTDAEQTELIMRERDMLSADTEGDLRDALMPFLGPPD